MAGRVTIQDIADALGLSRNTVSKAINNTDNIAEATREKILRKAMEMGYKTFSYAGMRKGPGTDAEPFPYIPAAEGSKKNIALFRGSFLDSSHFASTMLDKLQSELSLFGYTLTIHPIMQEDFALCRLPLSFDEQNTAAIICVEVFDYAYCQMLCSQGLPLLLVDAPVDTCTSPLTSDILLMENASGIYQIVKAAKQSGVTKIGFVGQTMHCRSFYERYMAFREAMYANSLPIDEACCLTGVHPHGVDYRAALRAHIQKMDHLPELFVCANDFVAIDVIIALRALGLTCPGDILLSGFDDAPESVVVTPSLTTCHIHTQIIGLSAAHMLLARIGQPELNYRIVHTETHLIYRESTRGEFDNAKHN